VSVRAMTNAAVIPELSGYPNRMFLTLALVVLTVAAGTCVILIVAHRHCTPRELRGDWWSDFEREFRAYARSAASPRRARQRHPGEPT